MASIAPKSNTMSRGSERSSQGSIINVTNSQLRKLKKKGYHGDSPAGASVICNFRGGLELDESELPDKLVVVIQTNSVSALEFLLITGCIPGLLAVLGNFVGSVDELHFERGKDSQVTMTKVRRFCSRVIKEPPVKVVQVGLEDESERAEVEKYLNKSNSNSGSNSGNSDSPSASNNEGKNVESLVVIDGQMGSKAKEVRAKYTRNRAHTHSTSSVVLATLPHIHICTHLTQPPHPYTTRTTLSSTAKKSSPRPSNTSQWTSKGTLRRS